MKIAFISTIDPENIGSWSGTLHYIFNSLKKRNEVKWFGGEFVEKAIKLHMIKYGIDIPFHPACYSDFLGYCLLNCQDLQSYDLLLVRDCYFFANINMPNPTVFIGDATYKQVDFLYTPFFLEFSWSINTSEALGLRKMDRIILSSNWAKNGTAELYNISPEKIDVIEFGANIDVIPSADITNQRISINTICNLVFIGKSAQGKGLKKAYEAYRILAEKGLKCTLSIIGCSDDYIDLNDPNVKIFFLDKKKADDRLMFHEILLKSHIHILPTQFDCFGIAFCETSAYGIPSITADVGGVSQVVKFGKNGFVLDHNASALDYANKIQEICSDETLYLKLSRSSIKEFNERLNWTTFSEKSQTIFEQVLINHKNQIYNYSIPTYICGLNRDNCDQFAGKNEFALFYKDIYNWDTVVEIIAQAISNDDDVIIICKPEHTFTINYSKEYFIKTMISAATKGAHILLSNVNCEAELWNIGENQNFVINYTNSNFIILYRPVFASILKYKNDHESIERSLKNITENIFVFSPSISKI